MSHQQPQQWTGKGFAERCAADVAEIDRKRALKANSLLPNEATATKVELPAKAADEKSVPVNVSKQDQPKPTRVGPKPEIEKGWTIVSFEDREYDFVDDAEEIHFLDWKRAKEARKKARMEAKLHELDLEWDEEGGLL